MPTSSGGADEAVAVAQTCPVRGSVEANLAEHLALAEVAASEGALVVLFPELSLTGYELDLSETLAFAPNDERLDGLRAAASLLRITIVAGAPVRIGAELQIGAFAVLPDSRIDLYTKRRLGSFPPAANRSGAVPPAERSVFAAGGLDPTIVVGGSRAAIAICADIGDPEHPRRAAAAGADLYLASMFVIPMDFSSDSEKLRRYAHSHGMTVALANYGAPSGSLPAAGRSAIWSKSGELLIQLEEQGAGVAVARRYEDRWETRAIMGRR